MSDKHTELYTILENLKENNHYKKINIEMVNCSPDSNQFYEFNLKDIRVSTNFIEAIYNRNHIVLSINHIVSIIAVCESE